MLIIFSPYSFLYFSSYLIFLFSLTQITNFYYYWSVMEIIILLFMGLSYSIILNSYSQLMLYFLIQTVASFLILVSYLYSINFILTLAFLIKLSMFPFFIWYINVVYPLPNFVFWLASTLHNVPPILIINVFVINLDSSLMWISIVLTTIIMGFMILSVFDFRILLVLSSIGNNSWLIISQIVHFWLFILYMVVYSLSMFFVFTSFGSLSNLDLSNSLSFKSNIFSFWVLTLSGIPPFPLFYCKVLVLYSLYFIVGVNSIIVLFLFSSAFMFISYLQSIMKYYVYVYSCSIFYLLNY